LTAGLDSEAIFSIELRALDDVLVLHGELDVSTAATLAATADLVGEGPGDLRLDLTDLDFCGSVGLSCLVALHNRRVVHGGRLVLLRPRPNVLRVLVTTGLDSIFQIEE
jgi:anti-sigma B factor antagonist